MEENFKNLNLENIEQEHVCCAISDKKHQEGVKAKKEWLKERIKEGHVFRKLDVNAKVFIEFAPLETAWVPIEGSNYLYIYCLWVAGSYKSKGYGTQLLNDCIEQARQSKKSGVCVLSSKKKQSFLSDKKFMQKFNFQVVDTIGDSYELLALSFDGTKPHFMPNAKKQEIDSEKLTIYYGSQCPYINNCIEQIEQYCQEKQIPVDLIPVNTLEKAKKVPCVFNNWAVFYKGKFQTLQLLNENMLRKLLENE
ncbi:MAG: GNAT family N-acetyltransferase [Clostridia bacterium]